MELSSARPASTLRSGEAAISSRHGAFDPGAGLRPVFSRDAGLEFAGGEEERRDDRRGDAAASGRRPLREVRVADPNLDFARIEPEFARDRVGDDAAGAGANVLHRRGGDETAALDRKLDLRSKLPQIEPVAHRDADAAAVAAGLRLGRSPPPRLEPGGPIVEALPIGVGVPALAQLDRVGLQPVRRLVDRLLERECHRRASGSAEGAARRQVADDVVVDKLLGFGPVDRDGRARRRLYSRPRRRRNRR